MEDLRTDDPRMIGPYRLIRRIGSGGMGVVYLAHDASGTEVALKLVRPELADDPTFRPRFRREVQAGQRVSGVCTAKYLDADLESDRPYLVTEFVAGGNLADYVAANGPLAGDQLVGLAVGLAEAIVAIHASGVIHRDLKPSNVLMAATGPKVVDFGISHAADGTSVTQSGVILGSPAWMAPEQAQGRESTSAVDVFSWGATVAFAATGRSPFGEGRPEAIIYRVVHEEPDLGGVDTRIRPVVAEALQKDPLARPTSDQALVSVVRSAMGGSIPPGDSDAMATVALDRTWKQPDPVPLPQSRIGLRRVALAAAALLVIAAFIGGVLYVADGDKAAKGPGQASVLTKRHTASTTSTSTSTTTSTTNPSALISASLPLVTCPTTYGYTSSTSPPALPTSMVVSVPADLTNQLAVYSDSEGLMKLVAPTGWLCSGNYGADGSGGVEVYPTGETVPSGALTAGSTAEDVSGSETSACVGCGESQACPLFATAAADYETNYQQTCPSRPSSESVVALNADIVSFMDPAGVAGDGVPSGGAYPANGVMTYYPYDSGNDDGSYIDTCTLPAAEQSICTVSLNRFVDWYGAD